MFSQYYLRSQNQEQFYKSALQFLAYMPTADLSMQQRKSWATKMGMAVLLGKGIFNIAELVSIFLLTNLFFAQLDKEVLQSLVGTDF